MATEEQANEFLKTHLSTILDMSRGIRTLGVRPLQDCPQDFGIRIIFTTYAASVDFQQAGGTMLWQKHPFIQDRMFAGVPFEFKIANRPLISSTHVHGAPQAQP